MWVPSMATSTVWLAELRWVLWSGTDSSCSVASRPVVLPG